MAMERRTWELAYRAGRKVFFEPATLTLRQCPQNYCLAVTRNGVLVPEVDSASPVDARKLELFFWGHLDLSDCPCTLAALVEEAFFGGNKLPPLVTFEPNGNEPNPPYFWQELVKLKDAGGLVEIGPGIWDYFLNVLPPKSMGETYTIDGKDQKTDFGFAEGREPIVGFWRENGRYFCQKTNVIAGYY